MGRYVARKCQFLPSTVGQKVSHRRVAFRMYLVVLGEQPRWYGKGQKMSWNHFYLPLEASNTSNSGSLLFGRGGLALQLSYDVSIELWRRVSSCPHDWLGFQHFGVLSSHPYQSGWMAEGALNYFSCTRPTFSLGLLLHLPMCGFLIPCFDSCAKLHSVVHLSLCSVSKQIKYIIYLYCSLALADMILLFCVAAYL